MNKRASHTGRRHLRTIDGWWQNEVRTPSKGLIVTPAQTIGPFFPPRLVGPYDHDLASHGPGLPRAEGQPIAVAGRVTDATAKPVPGVLIEVWQANRWGRYEHPSDGNPVPSDPNFKGYGRCLTGREGRYCFRSIMPAGYPNPGYDNWTRPPHLHFCIHAPGVLEPLITQMYFPDEPLNDRDPILNAVDEPEARASLIARLVEDTGESMVFDFDIVLRGERETPFFYEIRQQNPGKFPRGMV